MSTRIITLPSGMQGEVRNMKAKELAYLADPNNGKPQGGRKNKKALNGHPLDPVFTGCWLKTLDPGPYAYSVGEPVPWPKILVTDRVVALIHIRDLTWGAFEFKARCENSGCERSRKPFIWELDLNELAVKDLPAETIAKLKNNDRVFSITVDGKHCKFKLLNGEEEANQPVLSEDLPAHKKLLAQVSSRLIEVEGFPPDDEKIMDWVGELDLPLLYFIDKEISKVDGGVETRTIVECPQCGLEFTHPIPFADPGFLTPTPK